ncbi:hypothetical protein ONS95_002237 [Cadophora gregata]|uniref:uncharacterized protein n=1 Tax=Cadophora gregata TaxID=51156 RepID=UPI0026DB9F7D|nr:uncharacterized protein ONS95_002237 [Cadophora gregata]KAK0109551.1 hypothetical protein ONS95_002237 [Cadophora gregata]KAK0110822.1 hypothetical protein ONS96_002414 [Cadophora gregata f. sp. sojae]
MDFTTPSKWTCKGDVDVAAGFMLSNGLKGHSEITFDYEFAVGGMPVIESSSVIGDGVVEVDIIFSETYAGIQCETGDGPFFLFSNAMDTYRVHEQAFEPSETGTLVQLPFAQRSQRYQTESDSQNTELFPLHIINWLQANASPKPYHQLILLFK